jgi:hypothetical protein
MAHIRRQFREQTPTKEEEETAPSMEGSHEKIEWAIADNQHAEYSRWGLGVGLAF